MEDITKMVKGIASCEFPKEKSLAEYNPESGAQKYSKCQTPPYEKNKLTLNEYLGDFMHFESLFIFLCGNQSDPPPHPPNFVEKTTNSTFWWEGVNLKT